MAYLLKHFIFLSSMLSLNSFAQQIVKDSLPAISIQKGESVVIKHKKPFIESQIDKTVINVQNDMQAIGSNAFEILQKAPGIQISGEDVINMSGKAGVNILIDGRSTLMSSKDLANFLRAMPGTAIDKIELITNPSSRFEAQGNAGIINIRLKKIKIKGTNGNISLGYTKSNHYRSNGNFNINHRNNKINSFANITLNNNLQHTDGLIQRKITSNTTVKDFINSTIDIDRVTNADIRAGIDYYKNKKSTFGFLFNSNNYVSPFNTPGTTRIGSNGFTDSSLQTTNDNQYKNKRYNLNTNYTYEDTTGNTLNMDADYTYFNNTNTTNLTTSYLDKNNQKYNYTANDRDMDTKINIYALKADYTKKLKKINAAVETGLKLSKVLTENNLNASILSDNTMQADTDRTNTFRYKESIAAVYFNFTKKLHKIEYQIGLRTEQSAIKGKSSGLNNNTTNKPDTAYFNFFPSAFFSYAISEKNRVVLTYSKRINRPDYQSLNPFETIYDIYTSEKGNPYLKPQYTNSFEFKYSYRNALHISVGYNHTKDYSQTIATQTAEKTVAAPGNTGSLDNTYFSVNTPIPITKWWEGYANVTFFYNHYKGLLPGGLLNEKAFGLNYYIQNNFNLGKKWSAQLSSWFNAATKEAIFKTASYGSLDISVRKKIAKEKASLRLVLNDVLNTQRWKQTVQFANMDFTYLRKWESRGVRVQFTWAFGKTNYQARERETNLDAKRIKTK